MFKIVVTGRGLISALGNDVLSNRTSLISNRDGLNTLKQFTTKYAQTLYFGEVPYSNNELINFLNLDSTKGLTRTSLLALHAFQQAVKDANLNQEVVASPRTAFIGANTVGGMCLTDELYHDANKQNEGSEYINSYDPGSIHLQIQHLYNMRGVSNTINTACSSSANAIMFGARLIQNGLADRAIVGGCDSIAKFTINGFNSLHILSDQKCQPFDANRKGLNLGEGAAYLVLEKEEDALRSHKKIYGVLSGYSNVTDAFHPSSLSDNAVGPTLAMSRALANAGLKPEQIDYINAHGTGTENNDIVESRGMVNVFGANQVPAFSSTKSFTGHTLGASGAIEAVFSLLAIEFQEVYANLRFQNAIQQDALTPITASRKQVVNHVMSNAFGFGGNCSSLVFSKL